MTIKQDLRYAGRQAARADAEIDETFAPLRESPVIRALAVVGKLGDQPQLRLMSSALFVIGLATRNRRLSKAAARMLVAHELATGFKSFLKHRVNRTRPRSAQSSEQREIKRGHSRAKEESSFPSGHSAGAVAAARAFSREYPEHRSAALAAAGVIAGAQIPQSAHYLSDVAAGALVGTAAEAVSNLVFSPGDTLPDPDHHASEPGKGSMEGSSPRQIG